MGMNVFLEDVASYGYKPCASAAATMVQTVDGRSGSRIAIRAFGFTCGSVATSLHFMKVAGTTTSDGATASGSTTVKLTAKTITAAAAALTALDHLCFQMDNGVYHFTNVVSMGVATVEIVDQLVDTMKDGNTVWGFGVESDNGHIAYAMAANTQALNDLEGGIFYGNGLRQPMIIKQLSLTSSTIGSFDYATVGYINK